MYTEANVSKMGSCSDNRLIYIRREFEAVRDVFIKKKKNRFAMASFLGMMKGVSIEKMRSDRKHLLLITKIDENYRSHYLNTEDKKPNEKRVTVINQNLLYFYLHELSSGIYTRLIEIEIKYSNQC